MRTRLGIFLKAPEPGRVKTRLGTRMGPERTASLYTAFVLDVLSLARSARVGQRILWWSGSVPPAVFLRDLDLPAGLDSGDWPAFEQCDGDLGPRLAEAFARSADAPLLVIGSDSPDLPVAYLDRALARLEAGAGAVFGPVQDGGVWCIGLRTAPAGFFDGLPWSSERTAEALRARAREYGIEPTDLDPWYDCDTPDDLDALADRLRTGTSSATMTRRWLERFHGPATDPDSARVR